jgi:hypothetical protein
LARRAKSPAETPGLAPAPCWASWPTGSIRAIRRTRPIAAPEVSGPTQREAWERYRVSHLLRKKRSPATIAGYQDHVDRLFRDWADKPLA